MQYISTRGSAQKLSFEEAMLTGLARDGGLYVPEIWPELSQDEIAAFAGLSYQEIALRVMTPFVGDTFTQDEFRGIIERAYSSFNHDAICPLAQIGHNHFLLELFHGPTSWRRWSTFSRLPFRWARQSGACLSRFRPEILATFLRATSPSAWGFRLIA